MFLEIDRKQPDSPAAIDSEGISISYGEIVAFCKTMRKYLPPRELVFCYCFNSIGSLCGYIACYECRAVPLLLSAQLHPNLCETLTDQYRPSFIWAPEGQLGIIGDVLVRAYGYALTRTGYPAPRMHEQLSLLLTTSGTTGSPKLVRHKYGNLEVNAKTVSEVFKMTSNDRPVCDLPMQYTMGLNVINSYLFAGAALLLTSESLMSSKFWDFIKQYRATSFTGVPYSYDILIKLKFYRMDLDHLDVLAQGGGKLAEKNFRLLAEYSRKTGKRFFATFGTTETSARMSYLSPEMALDKIGSIGKAIPGGTMYLVDEHHRRLDGPGNSGELVYEGPNVTMGYAQHLSDLMLGDEFSGVYYTGDLAKQDQDGYFYIIGRKKRFLKLYGLRISLDQCEQLITQQFSTDCACIGNDEKMIVCLTDKTLVQDTKQFIKEQTGLLGKAFHVEVIDRIPRNDSGKILYRLLESERNEGAADE